MKDFFDTFPTLKVNSDLRFLFEMVQVESVSVVKAGNFLRVKIDGAASVSPIHLQQMEQEISKQVLQGAISVRFEHVLRTLGGAGVNGASAGVSGTGQSSAANMAAAREPAHLDAAADYIRHSAMQSLLCTEYRAKEWVSYIPLDRSS